MRSKTIKAGRHGHARVQIKQFLTAGRLEVQSPPGINRAFAYLAPKKLRAFGQACIQIADEIDAAKAAALTTVLPAAAHPTGEGSKG